MKIKTQSDVETAFLELLKTNPNIAWKDATLCDRLNLSETGLFVVRAALVDKGLISVIPSVSDKWIYALK